MPDINCYVAMSTFNASVLYCISFMNQLQAYSHLWQTLLLCMSYLFWSAGLDLTVLDYCLLGHIKDTHCWQKLHAREALLQQIMESADRTKGSDEIIIKAITAVLDVQNGSYRAVAYILISNQRNITED
jgi:hypothetical protein